jgi:hypothetical protein
MGTRQFLAFRFGRHSRFEGQLVGALERIESGGTMRILDGLFVSREPDSGELSAIAAVLVEHTWAEALADAVDRVGGAEIASEFVDVDGVSELTPRLLAAAQQQG